MDSAIDIRDDSGDALITIEANGRTFTILLCEDPRLVEGATGQEACTLGQQIYGLLDHYCGWVSRQRKVEAVASNLDGKRIVVGLQDGDGNDLGAVVVGPLHRAIFDALTESDDMAGGPELPGGRDVFDVGGADECLGRATAT